MSGTVDVAAGDDAPGSSNHDDALTADALVEERAAHQRQHTAEIDLAEARSEKLGSVSYQLAEHRTMTASSVARLDGVMQTIEERLSALRDSLDAYKDGQEKAAQILRETQEKSAVLLRTEQEKTAQVLRETQEKSAGVLRTEQDKTAQVLAASLSREIEAGDQALLLHIRAQADAIESQAKAVDKAFASSEKAIDKAAEKAEIDRTADNNYREQLREQMKDLTPLILFNRIEEQVKQDTARLIEIEARTLGGKEKASENRVVIGVMIAVATVIIAIANYAANSVTGG